MTPKTTEAGAWIVGTAGLSAAATGWIVAPAQFPHAWLAAVTCFIGWPLGSLALVFIHALTGGRWGLALRPQLAAGIATLPWVLPLLVPVLFVLGALYPWMRPDVAAQLHNRFYLNAPFFYVRGIVYLAVWLALWQRASRLLRRPDPQTPLYRLAPPALILLALTVTFAAVDTTLSLEPHFKSSIYGMLVGSEAILLALSIAVMGLAFGSAVPAAGSTYDASRLLLALLVLWAYLDFMQLLIIWNSDLPEEAAWYVHRLTGEWAMVAAAVAGLHFALPFFALLWPRVQRSRRAVGWLSALLVLMEAPRAWWLVIPAAGRNLHWVDAAAMIAVWGPAAGIALRAYHSPRQTLTGHVNA